MGNHGRKIKKKSENGSIDVGRMLHSLDKARWDHPMTLAAFKVMRALNDWINRTVVPESAPLVMVLVSAPMISLTIGEWCVWHSECDSEEDLTFEYCRDAYRREVLIAAAVLEL